MYVNEAECIAAGLDPKEVEKVAKGLARQLKAARALGVYVFGGSGSGSLRYNDGDAGKGHLVVADCLPGTVDGGDGATFPDEDGLLRGEH